MCEDGEFVIGFDQSGNIVCSDPSADCLDNLIPGADLRNCDLSGLDLTEVGGADFTGANLSGAIVDLADLNNAILDDTYCPDGILSNGHSGGTCDGAERPH
jgi:uncharacterized protein YjbI with pentapeptide repeats